MRLIDGDALIEQIETNICKPCKERKEDHNGVRCRACQYGDEIDDIEDAPTVGEWIPCSERLPEDVEIGEEYPTVIFCTADGVVRVGGYEHYLGGKWWYMDTWEDEAQNVIAWMPLPEPSRRENDRD